MAKHTENLPALGQMMRWLDKPGTGIWLFRGLLAVCLMLFLADFTYEKYGFFAVETLPGIYGVFGILTLIGLVIVARILRIFLQRSEDFYGSKSVDTEEFPADQLNGAGDDA